MTVRGWEKRYAGIRRRFGYSRMQDEESAALLEEVLRAKDGSGAGVTEDVHDQIGRVVRGRPVLVVGAGHSVTRSLPVLKRHAGDTAVIAADSATRFLVENGVMPDIVVTDLDGDRAALLRASRKSIMVVHAHGDNIGMLAMASGFPRCVGTTQSRPSGVIANFGGFTDGDRAAFLAHHFGARVIILLGMDFDGRIGRHSDTPQRARHAKLQKLEEAQRLLSWLASMHGPPIVSTSHIPGIRRVVHAEIGNIIIT